MIHLIVGNTGAGKTTYSNELKKTTNGIIFSIDTWNTTLFYTDKKPTDGLDWILERIERSETMIMELVEQLEHSKMDSILDLGLSKFTHREKFRTFAKSKGYTLKTHFLDVSKETRLTRVMKRNQEKGDTFELIVSKEDFDFMEEWFEKPNSDEMSNGIILTE